ncbi:ImmA/IrrE family metallo-endopeptidase [Roseospira visakhapatnamensis]|uniref:Zn-dependent peptidase ImmA (M78 family) n=1 Tax=Roseospira visakhapatnamensis TaxID=390880 RepID=A0A7W6RHH5_9PROT|nr:ImmA/IrrE family metallo-endopeptidase [Roseospira visakhapatnamensis]MBB4267973.1 Zn-dependent peptidase ImmA (M78 family) [Roseospira visakhapatnamensis]
MTRVPIAPHMLRWARERAGLEVEDLLARFKTLPEWEAGEASPTLKQLDAFARAVHVPVGTLFLPEPPDERLPIPDFRTVENRAVARPSPNLLDMLYVCQERQAWYRDFAQVTRQPPRAFVGRADRSMAPDEVAADIRATLGVDLEQRAACRTWKEALRLFIQQADQAGVLVMVSGVVLSNTRRTLNPQEFRGFALSDPLAPLVFINGADTKSAQMFTLAHELAHLWLNATGLSDAGAAPVSGGPAEEVWCNAVAAEVLVPLAALRPALADGESLGDAVPRLTRRFKVSSLVILRRLLDAGWLDRAAFEQAWQQERARLLALSAGAGGGGDFYRTTISRVSRRFTRAVVSSTLEGQTLYRDAFRMLGVAKTSTFNTIGREVGVML